MKLLKCALVVLLVHSGVAAQHLKPGFDKQEYLDMMSLSARFGSAEYYANIPVKPQYAFVYRSPIMGLDNCWDLWVDQSHKTAIISIRGTTQNSVSWLSNFYAAMVPAKGSLQMGTNEVFDYELAADPKAAVHVGWLLGTAYLAKDILPKLDSCYRTGIKDMIVMGHSQGGGIGFLLTSHLYHLQDTGKLPADIRFKTYCSAGPKPGNLYYAYAYEARTQQGWAYNVVNSADWVPEVPMSIQTVNDFNNVNPFKNAKAAIRKQKFPARMALKHVYKKLDKPTRKAQRNYQKYLGEITSEMVKKNVAGFEAPDYYNSNNYVRTGATIVLLADSAYYTQYPENPEELFRNHFHPPYMLLASQLPDGRVFTKPDVSFTPGVLLNGTWELDYIASKGTPVEKLYPNKRPSITFSAAESSCSGTTGCNQFHGLYQVKGNVITIGESLALTKMFCEGEGERLFLDYLTSGTCTYSINDGSLSFIRGDMGVMRFTRKN